MDSESSSKTEDSTHPSFIEQGDTITCVIGDSTLLAREWNKDKAGVKATLTFQKGAGPIATDGVTLSSQKWGGRFINSLPECHRRRIEPALIPLEEYLRTKMGKADVKKNTAAAVTLSDDETTEALDLLRDPDLIAKFLE